MPPRATSASLAALVDQEGAALIPAILALASEGALPPGAIPSAPGSRVPPLRPEHGILDFTRSAVAIDRQVRAAQGELHAHCFYRGMKLIVLEGAPVSSHHGAASGRIAAIEGDVVIVGANPGAYGIRRFLFLDRVYAGAALAAELGLAAGEAFTAR